MMVRCDVLRLIGVLIVAKIYSTEAFGNITIDEVTTSTIAITWHGDSESVPNVILQYQIGDDERESEIALDEPGKRYEFVDLPDGTQFKLLVSNDDAGRTQTFVVDTARCPTGWKGFRNSCYITKYDEVARDLAAQRCKNLFPSAHLADPRTDKEYNFITGPSLLPEDNSRLFWIGITMESENQGHYTDGSEVTDEVKEHRGGQKSDSPEMRCVALNPPSTNWIWAQAQCSASAYYVCEYPVPQSPTKVQVEATTPTSASISWTTPVSLYESTFTNYSIHVRQMYPVGDVIYSKTFSKDVEESYDVTGLEDGKLYYVTVAADDGKNGGNSAVIRDTAFVTNPVRPTNLDYSDMSYDWIDLEWDMSKHFDGTTPYKWTITYEDGGRLQTDKIDTLSYYADGLIPYTDYTFTVQAIVLYETDTHSDPFTSQSDGTSMTIRTDVAYVDSFAIVDGTLNETGFTLTWEPAIGRVDGYRIKISTNQADSDNRDIDVDSTATDFEVTGLVAGETYTIDIVTVIEDDTSEAVTLQQTTRPPALKEVILRNSDAVDAATFLIRSSDMNPNAIFDEYRFIFLNVKTQEEAIRDFDKVMTDIIADRLNPGSEYKVSAYRRSNGVLSSPPYGMELRLGVAAPENFRYSFRNETVIIMSWVPSVGEVTGYLVECDDCPVDNVKTLGVDDENKALFEKLSPGEEYTFTIQARNEARISKLIAYTLRTMPNAPKPTEVTDFNKTAVTASWPAVSGTREGYVVEYAPLEGQTSTITLDETTVDVVDDGNQDEIAAYLYNLIPGISYNGSVRTVMEDTYSSPALIEFSTKPNPVKEIRIIEVGEYWCHIRWIPGDGGYEIFQLIMDMEDLLFVQDTKELEYNVTLPKPATSYHLEITTIAFDSRESTPVVVHIQTRPLSVTELDVDEITHSSLIVRWNPPKSSYDEFLIVLSGEDMEDIEKNTATSYVKYEDLKPGKSYSVKVYTTHNGTKSYHVTKNATLYPATPSGLISTTTTSKSLAVSWEKPPGIVGSYKIVWHRSDDKNQSESDDVMEESAVLTDLTPGVKYVIQVFSRSQENLRTSKTAAYIELTTEEDYPGLPNNLTVTQSPNATTLLVAWEETETPNGIILHYTVSFRQIYPHPEPDFRFEDISPPVSATYLGYLEPGAWYIVMIRAENSKGAGNWTDTIAERTVPWLPGPVSNLQAKAEEIRSLTISWEVPSKPNGDIQSYTLSVRDKMDDQEQTIIFTRDPSVSPLKCFDEDEPIAYDILSSMFESSNLTVEDPLFESLCPVTYRQDNLLPYKDYIITVRASTEWEEGELATINATTSEEKPGGPPQNIIVINVDPTSITFQWEPPGHPNGKLTYYIDFFSQGGEMLSLETDETVMTVSDLAPFSTYAIEVVCGTSAGLGEPLKHFVFLNTTEDTPDQPQDLVGQVMNSKSIYLRWKAPQDPRGIVTEYEITIYDKQASEELRSDMVPSTKNNETENLGRPLNPVTVLNENVPVDKFGHMLDLLGSNVLQTTSPETVKYLVEGLRPYTEYTFFVKALTSAGAGESSNVSFTTAEDIPSSSPTNLQYTNLTSTSVNLTWSEPENPNGAIVAYTVVFISNEGLQLKVSTTTHVVLDNLKKNSLYQVFVYSKTSVGEGPSSERFLMYTDEDVPESPPLNPTYYNVTPTVVRVEFEPPVTPNGVIRFYTVYFRNSTGEFSHKSNSTAAFLTNLKVYGEYVIRIGANTKYGDGGQRSEPLYIRTGEGEPGTPPSNLMYTNLSPTSVELKWKEPTEPNGIIVNYEISFESSDQTQNKSVQTPGANTEYVLQDLTPYANYTLHVRARTKHGDGGQISDPLEVHTMQGAPGTPPVNLVYENISSTAIKINWDGPEVPNGVVTIYTIYYDGLVETTSDTQILLDDLNPYTSYEVKISSSTSAGEGPSATLHVYTDEDVPSSPPRDLTYSQTSSTEITLSWLPPRIPNGRIVEYTIRYYKSEGADEEVVINTPETSEVLSDLEKHTQYIATVSASTIYGEGGQYAGPVEFKTLEDAPSDPPYDVSLIAKSSTSLAVSWKPPKEPNGVIQFYTVYFEEEGGSVGSIKVFDRTDYTVTGLKKFTWYNVHVTASTGLGDGDQKSEIVRMQTLEGVPDSGVQNLTSKPFNSTMLDISWSAPSPITGVLTYGVVVREGGSKVLIEDLKTSENYQEIVGLEPYTQYDVTVIPFVLKFAGPETTINATTPEDLPGSPVGNLRAVSITHDKAELEWDDTLKPNGIIISHLVVLEWNDTLREKTAQHPMSASLDGLLPRMLYKASVFPETNIGLGPPASVTFTTTSGLPEGPPRNVLVSVSPRRVSISWDPPPPSKSSLTGYKILYHKIDRVTDEVIAGSEKFVSLPSSEADHTFTDLVAFTTYSFVVKASSKNGYGPGSEPFQITTPEDVPSSPLLECSASGQSEAILRWEDPKEPNGLILSYEVAYYEITTPDTRIEFELDGDGNENQVSKLIPNTQYIFEVRAVTKPGAGEPAACIVTTDEGIADAPESLRVTDSTSESLSLIWLNPNNLHGKFSHYEIFYRPPYNCWRNGGSMVDILEEQSCKVKSAVTTKTLSSLRNFHNYTVTVGAANGAGLGVLSDEVTYRTKAGVPTDPATEITAVEVSSTKVNVTWREPLFLAGPTTYQARFYVDDKLVHSSKIASSSSRNIVVSDLEEDTYYKVTVLAITSAGSLESPESAFVRTLEDAPSDPPANITIKTLPGNSSSVIIEFLPPTDPNGAIHEYNIEYKLGMDGPITTINLIDHELPYLGELWTNHSVYVTNLLGGRAYYFRMNAATLVGIGDWLLGIGPWSNWSNPVVLPVNPPPVPMEPIKVEVPTESNVQSTSTLNVDICIFSDVNGPLSNITVIVAEDGTDLQKKAIFWFQAYQLKPSPPYSVLATTAPSDFCGTSKGSTRNRRSIDTEPKDFVLGEDESCTGTQKPYCNGPLKSNTPYRLKLKGTTTNGESTETEFSDPVTTRPTFLQANLYLIVGLLVGIVVLVLFISILAHCLRRRLHGQSFNESQRSTSGANKRVEREVSPTSQQNLSFVMEPTNAKGNKAITRPVVKSIFANHVSRMSEHNDKGFLSEFEEIESVTPFGPKTVGSQPFNTAKNRFPDIIPYNHYRVKIEDIASIEGSSYINASYIPGKNSPEQYIATQSPLGHTKNDFWRMVWETGSQKIVMLCNVEQEGQDNITKYWPGVSQTTYFGNLAVQTLREDRMAECTVRTLSISKRDKRRQVTQYHYTMWPLRGVPENPQPFARFLHATRSAKATNDRPTVVMCSSGSGRTAVFIALDSIVDTLAKQSRVDPCGVVAELRNYRPFMIQTVAEYSFLHRCLAYIIDNNGTTSSSVRSPTGDGVEETTMF